MKHLKKYNEDIDIFSDDDWDFDEEENDELEIGDYIIFLPNPEFTYNNNFAIRKVISKSKKSIMVRNIIGNDYVLNKHEKWYRKLYTKKSWDLKAGDYFFGEGSNDDYHYVYIVNNIKMGGVICDIQPLNYGGGMVEENKLVNHGEILIPDEETKKIIDKKINRIKKGR